MSTVPAHKVKFYDESGFDLTMYNPSYGHAYKENHACEIVSGRKGVTWTLVLLRSLDGIDYAIIVVDTVDTVEYFNSEEKLQDLQHLLED